MTMVPLQTIAQMARECGLVYINGKIHAPPIVPLRKVA